MREICHGYGSPEEINEGRESHPSYRLMQIVPAYQKTLHGPLLALEMGLIVIRNACISTFGLLESKRFDDCRTKALGLSILLHQRSTGTSS